MKNFYKTIKYNIFKFLSNSLRLLIMATIFIAGLTTIIPNLKAFNSSTNSDVFAGNPIDLRINQKPKNISTYQWCKDRAEELVREKRIAVLRLLGRIENNVLESWEDQKENLAFLYKKAITEKELVNYNQNLPEKFIRVIKSVLSREQLKQELGISQVIERGNTITVRRSNGQKEIKFLCETQFNKIDSPAASDGYNVLLSENSINRNNISNEILESFIGHELGHIKNKHITELYCLNQLKSEVINKNERIIPEYDYEKALRDLSRAQEIQADIAGTFGDLYLIKFLKQSFEHQVEIYLYNNLDPSSCERDINHPSFSCRANYLEQIYTALQNDINIKNLNNNQPRNNTRGKSKVPATTQIKTNNANNNTAYNITKNKVINTNKKITQKNYRSKQSDASSKKTDFSKKDANKKETVNNSSDFETFAKIFLISSGFIISCIVLNKIRKSFLFKHFFKATNHLI